MHWDNLNTVKASLLPNHKLYAAYILNVPDLVESLTTLLRI